MSVVSMKELLEAGVHFGHQTKRWDPRMKPYIFTKRKGIHILDLQQTIAYLDKTYKYVKDLAAQGKKILFVGTKKQAQAAIKQEAERCGMPYVNYRWLGGMLTNFSTISKSKEKLEELDTILNDEEKKKNYTKKEILKMTKLRDRLLKVFEGIRNMNSLPDAVFIIDTKIEETAVLEARKLGIPIIAVVDTNCNPELIDYPIPGNDDAIRAVALFASVIANAIINGQKELQMNNEGQDATKIEEEGNVAYVSRIDKASEEDIKQRTFTADNEEEEIKKTENENTEENESNVSENNPETTKTENIEN